jgi:hypothetical protein
MFGFWIIPIGMFFGFLCSIKAKKKERSSNDWFILGFIFSAAALLVITLLPDADLKDEKLNLYMQ